METAIELFIRFYIGAGAALWFIHWWRRGIRGSVIGFVIRGLLFVFLWLPIAIFYMKDKDN